MLYFWRRGQGPGEFASFSTEQTGSAGVFAVRPHRIAGPTVELYDFSGEGVKQKGTFRDRFDPNPRNSSLAYVALFSDGENIYAVNARADMHTLEQERTMDIVLEVFDWAGKKVKAFRFDKTNRMPVFVDGPRRTVYALAMGEDFDRIYSYKMNL